MKPSQASISALVTTALAEDVGQGDITAALLDATQCARAIIKTRSEGVLCGAPWAEEVFAQLSPQVNVSWVRADGEQLAVDETFCELEGPLTPLLTGERTAVNFLQMLSGTATLTQQFVQAAGACDNTLLLDTRKTIPGCRAAQKYAVHCGGGTNHRQGLFDALLVKENHIRAFDTTAAAIKHFKAQAGERALEVEVENLRELGIALATDVDTVMLDNFTLDEVRQAVSLRDAHLQQHGFYTKLEVSGNVDKTTIRGFAATGVDAISIGALTKHVMALDLSMQIVKVY